MQAPSSGYRLDARIIQKKDQIEELSTPGYKAPSRSVEEVRTGQQFLIKLQFLRNDGSHATEFPAMRLERRSAINTSGEPASEPEELTLEIIVRLEKSGQYGPSSPILLLLDPLSPSPTDPIMYSHIDIYTGSLTLLAKVVCSSTDHSERGNKDRYIFEFLVKRTSPTSSSMRSSLSPGLGEGSESGEIIASCVTTPVMCSGHHKAKRLLVDQRVEKATRAVPTPKTKVIKRRKSVEGSMSPYHLLADSDTASENMATTPVPMSLSPSTYPVTSVAPTPSMLDVQMPGHDGQPSSPASSLFPPATGAASHVSPQSPVHNPRLDEYVSVGPQNGLMSVSSATSGFPSSSTASSSPSITEIRPNQGPIRKATHVAIRGMSFREGMVPYFGCFPATEIVVETSTLMLCRVPESPLPGTVPVTICEGVSASYTNLSEFTYTDDNETELLILQLQLRMAHRALEYLHAQATGQQGTASDILRSIPGCLSPSPPANAGGSYGATTHSAQCSLSADEEGRTSHRPLTLEQVEQGLLKTIEHLPMAIDISMELEDGSNLLHLSILMGFTKLALELIQHGCEIEAYDKWGYTPLMYAVFMGQIDIVQALVQAGASASGAKTPNEFYTRLGRAIDRNDEISALLNTACERYQTEECCQWQGSPTLAPSTESAQTETQGNNHGEVECPQPSVGSDSSEMERHPPIAENNETILSRLSRLVEGLHVLTTVHPQRHQSLPLLQDAGEDERGALSPRTILSSQLADEPDPATSMKCDAVLDVSSGAEQQQQQQQQQQQESGYHSGVISEVQDRLKEMHRQQLPTTGIDMHVKLRRLESSSTMLASSASSTKVAEAVAASLGSSSGLALSPSSLSSPPSSSSLSSTMTTPSTSRTIASEVATDPFRTGDYFVFEIDLTVNTAAMADGHALPSSYLGLRFPHELVKRTSGKAPSLLDEMTYDIKCSVELGPHSATAAHGEDDMDRLKVAGACKDCNKWLHEQGRHSPSRSPAKNPDWSPVVQFGIPMPLDQHHHHYHHHQQHGSVGGVVEVHNGRCEVKARVHCSSMHHLVQREKERFMAIKRERERAMMDLQQQGSSEYDPEWKTKLQVEANRVIKNLKDPGYVFVFELVHPETHEVVATARTAPMIFRTFQRRK
ncbi:SPT3 Dosage dependent suppressor of Ty-induced promoter mutations-like protein [Actinomortierella wolfii]|nr:SPT3 Dosage dependent suppressor of Ty-induced promoter mutations-like protein [Actinomortierella wolfii]